MGIAVLKNVAAVLNKVLNAVEVRPRRRTIPSLISQPRLATAGKIIEFIGTQGIGKSTLNNDLHKSLKDNWFFRADLGQVGPAETSLGEIERLHRDIYFHRINHLQEEDADPWKSITAARQMSKVISESLTIQTNEFPRGFILDESLFKNFPREVLALASEHPEPLWVNRAFVYLRARDPNSVVARYQNRVEERSNRGLPQRRPSDAEVRMRVAHDNDLFDRILEKAEAFDCPAIVVYAEDDHKENINRILQFEKQLRLEAWTDPVQDRSQA